MTPPGLGFEGFTESVTDAPDPLEGEPTTSGRLVTDPELVERVATRSINRPSSVTAFTVQHLRTQMRWDEVVLHSQAEHQIRQIEAWVKDNPVLVDDGKGEPVKSGHRVLFHGPAGSGKRLSAALLGKATSRPVVRVDLSRVTSKYIGETEKNVSRLFDQAREKGWILFFDEADALFGKRTAIRDAHDKYANQEVAYLLQAIETHPGLVILATTQRDSIDEAVLRRLDASIEF